MTMQFIWAYLSAFPLVAFQLILAISFVIYFAGKALLNAYHQMLVDVGMPTVSQKIELLSTPLVREKFTLQSPVGKVNFDLQLKYARAAMEQAQAEIEKKQWTAAYRLIKSAKANLADYNLGQIPPRDCPQPRKVS
ncbi:MAG: hypothetical protein JST01_16945 [Cyanobacteria bacterium SZAS TMP-1]|nr:hypothetical protein [Cyanobacteria bacterium SZAS TMP-1]